MLLAHRSSHCGLGDAELRYGDAFSQHVPGIRLGSLHPRPAENGLSEARQAISSGTQTQF